MYARGSSIEVYGPQENHLVTSGSLANFSRAGASPGCGARSVKVGPCRAMLALLYDIHGNLPALEAVLADAHGADEWLLGGDMVPFGPYPDETLERLQALDGATWIRGNTERWLVDRHDLEGPMTEAVEACRAAIGDARADELAALPESAALDGGLAVHASPASDMRSFMPEPGDDEAELLDVHAIPSMDA